MNWLNSISVRAKLALIVTVALLALSAVAAHGLFALRQASTTGQALMDREFEALKLLGQARVSVGHMRRFEKDLFLNLGNEAARVDYLKRWKHEVAAGGELMRTSRRLLITEEQVQLDSMLSALDNYRRGFEAIAERIQLGTLSDAGAANKAMEPVKGDVRAMDLALDALGKAVDGHVREKREDLQRGSRQAMQVDVALVALMGLLLGGLAWAVAGHIGRALAQAVHTLDSVAAGDLSHPIAAQGSDELARMTRAMASMQEALRGLVQGIKGSADGVASASAQIALGNADLSERTERQAASLQQTAAAMTELAVTVRASAETARQASTLASGASTVAGRGGQLVGEVVITMNQIQAASKRIADIIGVIDAIAFQTNILALNAAVEAARAGEQGRGFAVVATEVRSLAGRSAAAAREIKQLINASNDSVAGGSAVVAQAGQNMAQIVEQVQRVSTLINELSSATGQQSQGLEQIGQALSELDSTTQQNAALVEESSAAAESLKSQAGQLATAAAAFRLA